MFPLTSLLIIEEVVVKSVELKYSFFLWNAAC
jgi:hypothetical protein